MATRLVIFDFDGTLGDTRQNIVLTMQQVMRQLELDVADEATCASTIGLPLTDCFRKIYPYMTAEQAEHCAETYRQFFFANAKMLVPQPFPHVMETLHTLHERGIAMAIASSRTSRSLLGFVKEMGFSSFIRMVVGCEDIPRPKPYPDPVFRILADLGFSANQALVVGDMPVDIQMGQAAGADTCAVTYGNSSVEDLLSVHPAHLINDMAELPALIGC